MMNIDVLTAELVESTTGPQWMIGAEITEDDGTVRRHAYTFPEDTFEWRAAEYALDPADFETLLETVLYEFHLPPEEGFHPLVSEATPERARERHRARLAAVKGAGRVRGVKGASPRVSAPGAAVVLESGEEDPLATLRRESPLSPLHIAVKARYSLEQRDRLLEQLADAAAAPRRPARSVTSTYRDLIRRAS